MLYIGIPKGAGAEKSGLKVQLVLPIFAVRALMRGGPMRGKASATIAFVLAVLLTTPQIVVAQGFGTKDSDWRVVLAVKPRTKVIVTLLDGTEVQGKLRNVSDTTIVLADGKKTRTVARQDVRVVYRLKKSIWKSARNGASLGIRSAAAVTRRIWEHPDAGGSFLIIAPAAGIAIASASIPLGLGGLVVGAFQHHRERIY